MSTVTMKTMRCPAKGFTSQDRGSLYSALRDFAEIPSVCLQSWWKSTVPGFVRSSAWWEDCHLRGFSHHAYWSDMNPSVPMFFRFHGSDAEHRAVRSFYGPYARVQCSQERSFVAAIAWRRLEGAIGALYATEGAVVFLGGAPMRALIARAEPMSDEQEIAGIMLFFAAADQLVQVPIVPDSYPDGHVVRYRLWWPTRPELRRAAEEQLHLVTQHSAPPAVSV